MTHRALLLGYGSIGQKRARILRDFGWTVTIWEPDLPRQYAAVADGFTDVQPLGIFDITRAEPADVAFVCSPTIYHAEHAIACLEHGCHVFIEKPIAHTLQDAHRIFEAWDRTHFNLMVGCNYRFWDGIRIQPEQIDRLEITFRYHLPTARPDWREGYVNDPIQGGVILDSGSHAMDLARSLAGPIDGIANVYLGKLVIGALVEEDVAIHLQHKNGIRTAIRLNWTSKRVERTVTFHTKTGHRWVSELWDGTDKMFEREMRTFLRCVKDGTAPPNGPAEATETLRWCLEARDMVRSSLRVAT